MNTTLKLYLALAIVVIISLLAVQCERSRAEKQAAREAAELTWNIKEGDSYLTGNDRLMAGEGKDVLGELSLTPEPTPETITGHLHKCQECGLMFMVEMR